MVNVLEHYFTEQVIPPGDEPGEDRPTEAERAFLEKYLGRAPQGGTGGFPMAPPVPVESVTGPLSERPDGSGPAAAAADDPAAVEAALREVPEIRLVSFRAGGQEFAVPICQVQEVIRAVAPTRIPAAPAYLAGMMNLRGRVTPLIDTATLLGLPMDPENRFIIVARGRGLLLGLLVESISTMHQGRGEDIEWGLEAKVGLDDDIFSGLLKKNDRLLKILSIDSLLQKVLNR